MSASRVVLTAYGVLILLTGLLGNACCGWVLHKRRLDRRSTTLLFVALSLTDSLALIISVTRYLLIATMRLDIRLLLHHDLFCKTHLFATHVSKELALCVLCLLATERFLLVIFAHRVQVTYRRVAAALAASCVLVVAKNGHLWNAAIYKNLLQDARNITNSSSANSSYSPAKYIYQCDSKTQRIFSKKGVDFILWFSVYALLLGCNLAIYLYIRRQTGRASRRLRRSQSQTQPSPPSPPLPQQSQVGNHSARGEVDTLEENGGNHHQLHDAPPTPGPSAVSTATALPNVPRPSRTRRAALHGTKIMVTLVLLHFAFSFPLVFMHVVHMARWIHPLWVDNLALMLYYTNNVLNFPAFVLASPRFRQGLSDVASAVICTSDHRSQSSSNPYPVTSTRRPSAVTQSPRSRRLSPPNNLLLPPSNQRSSNHLTVYNPLLTTPINEETHV